MSESDYLTGGWRDSGGVWRPHGASCWCGSCERRRADEARMSKETTGDNA